jgi:hypothetical protein
MYQAWPGKPVWIPKKKDLVQQRAKVEPDKVKEKAIGVDKSGPSCPDQWTVVKSRKTPKPRSIFVWWMVRCLMMLKLGSLT